MMRLCGLAIAVAACTGSASSIAYNGEVRATLSGNALNGSITYTGADNGNTDCAGITGCESAQDIAGTRPPP